MTTTSDDEGKPRPTDRGRNSAGRRPKGALGSVIHVNFRSGGRLSEPPVSLPDPSRTHEPEGSGREPLTDLFSFREVAKLLGLSEGRLRSLDRSQIVSPSGQRNGKRAYTFQDLIALRATHGLLESQVRLRDVAEAIGALKKTLPRVTKPLQELRIVSDGRRVVVRAREGTFEPLTGQYVLDFQVTSLRDDVVRVLRPQTAAQARTAYDLYTRASALDENVATYDQAEALYTEALRLDPKLAIAYTNLGNVRFRRGDEAGAMELYERALRTDPDQPEAH